MTLSQAQTNIIFDSFFLRTFYRSPNVVVLNYKKNFMIEILFHFAHALVTQNSSFYHGDKNVKYNSGILFEWLRAIIHNAFYTNYLYL
jgi:hypothetical protein